MSVETLCLKLPTIAVAFVPSALLNGAKHWGGVINTCFGTICIFEMSPICLDEKEDSLAYRCLRYKK